MSRGTRKRLECVSKDDVFVLRALHGPELLIQMVEKFPCLWDIRDDNHFKKDERDLAWQKVCEEVFEDWHEMDKNEKFNKVADIKKKWTHIRDYYRKDLIRIHKLPPGTDMRRQKRYIFHDMLHFLAPLYDYKITNKTDAVESDSTTQEELDFSENPCFDFEDENSVLDPISLPLPKLKPAPKSNLNASNQSSSSSAKKRKATTPFEILEPPKHENENLYESAAASLNDDDTNFLLSLRGDMSQLNHSKKLEFKIGVLQLLQKLLYTDTMKRPNVSTVAVQHESAQISNAILKMSPIFFNENSHSSFAEAINFRTNNKE